MTQRIVSSLILIALIALPIWWGGLLFLGAIIIVATIAVWEFYDLAAHGGYRAIRVLGTIALVLIIVASSQQNPVISQLGIAILVFGGLIWELLSPTVDGKLREWALTLVGVMYIGWPASMLVSLRAEPDGIIWVLLILIGTAACDSMAYVAGHLFGRQLFAPKYSPKKTWEGTIGGVLGCLIAVTGFGAIFLDFPIWQIALLGLLLGPFAIVGDLAESMIKRRIGVKDSSDLIPGHGGLLDRVDSLLFTITVTYFAAQWMLP